MDKFVSNNDKPPGKEISKQNLFKRSLWAGSVAGNFVSNSTYLIDLAQAPRKKISEKTCSDGDCGQVRLTAKVLATCLVELYFPMETQRHDP